MPLPIPIAARECYDENLILRRIGEKCVEQTGGLFVRLPGDSKRFREMFLRGCEEVGIPAEAISSTKALDLVPNLNPEIEEAIKVPDCSIDPFRLCMLNIRTSELRGGLFLHGIKLRKLSNRMAAASASKPPTQATGEVREIRGNIIVNATGAWANMIASLAGCEVPMTLVKGSLVITNHRLTDMVINRLRPSFRRRYHSTQRSCLSGRNNSRWRWKTRIKSGIESRRGGYHHQ